jgi:RimJ/RimL family protein N-acetyltransferase
VAHNAKSWEGLGLYTDRLRLRTPTPRDADALYDLFKDPDVMHGLGKEPVSGPEQARAIVEEWIAAWRTDALGPFIIETAATNRRVVGEAVSGAQTHASRCPGVFVDQSAKPVAAVELIGRVRTDKA